MKARVTVYPRSEILDPQGLAIKNALGRIGFEHVDEVRAGKSFEIALGIDDREKADELLKGMCRNLLANPVVEDYAIEILEEGAPA